MTRPRQVTTNAAVIESVVANAALTAWWSFASPISFGSASVGSILPMGHGWLAGSGSALLTATGVKFTDVLPTGSVTQPWLPRYFAVRVTPLGSVMCTA